MPLKTFTLKIFLAIVCGSPLSAWAANYYWVGGTGSWSDYANHWATTSGGNVFHTQVPSSLDNVYFDANSFPAIFPMVTLDTTIVYCRDMDWTGALNNPTFRAANTSIELKVFGSLTLNPVMQFVFNGKLSFTALTPGKTITTLGEQLACDIVFNGTGGEWILQDSFATTKIITLTYGTLRTNNHNLKCKDFRSVNNNVRALYLGTSTVELVQSGEWQVDGVLTIDADSSIIKLTDYGNFYSDGHSYNIIEWNIVGFSMSSLRNDNLIIKKVIYNGNSVSSGFSFESDFSTVDSIIVKGAALSLPYNRGNRINYISVDRDFNKGYGVGDTINTLIVKEDAIFGASTNGGVNYIKSITVHGNLNILLGGTGANNQTFDTCTLYGNGTFLSDNNDLGVLTVTQGKTLTFGASKTQVIDSLIPRGVAGFPIQLVSSDLGVAANVTINSPLCTDYLYIHSVHASGNAALYAGANSNDVANNSGWLFSNCSPIACNISGNNSICAYDSTSFIASGGLSYTWSGPAGFSASTASTGFINTAGVYNVTITDSSGNSATCSRFLIVNAAPVCSITGDSVICGGGSTTFTASGGSAYRWSGPNGFTDSTRSAVQVNTPGIYSVTVTNASGCSTTCLELLRVDTIPACSISGSSSICAGTTTALTASGGATYLWTGPAGFSSTSAGTGPIGTAGVYSVRITDGNGCLTNCNTPLLVTQISLSTTSTGISCPTCNDGTARAFVQNGTAPFTYTWSTTPIQTTHQATGLPSGTYTACVSDANGCTACSSAFVDSINCTSLSVTTQSTNASCSVCSDGVAWANVSGGRPPYNVTWLTTPMQTNDTATGLLPGTYVVCVVDSNGCNICDTVSVITGNCAAFFELYPDTVPHQYYAIDRSSGNTPFTYIWTWGDGSADTAAFPSHTYASSGLYTICLSITDSVGCTDNYCNPYFLMKTGNEMVQVNVIDPLATGVTQLPKMDFIKVSPNPAASFVNISFDASVKQASIRFIDLLGATKLQALTDDRQPRIDISDLAGGVYLLEVTANGSTARKKIIKL